MFVAAAAIVSVPVIVVVFERPAAVITDVIDIWKILTLLLAAHIVLLDGDGDDDGNTVADAFPADSAAVVDVVAAGEVSVFHLGLGDMNGSLAFRAVAVWQKCMFAGQNGVVVGFQWTNQAHEERLGFH